MADIKIRRIKCTGCQGTGKIEEIVRQVCKNCNGKGWVDLLQEKEKEVVCADCFGVGLVESTDCSLCMGKGYHVHIVKEKVYVEEEDCESCEGSGVIEYEQDCDYCNGEGRGFIDGCIEYECSKCDGKGKITEVIDCQDCFGDGYIENELIEEVDITPVSIVQQLNEAKKRENQLVGALSSIQRKITKQRQDINDKAEYIRKLKCKVEYLEKKITEKNEEIAISFDKIHKLPFEIFPNKEWGVEDIISQCNSRVKSMNFSDVSGTVIDVKRIESIGTLNPVDCYLGKNSWSGYVVFTFKKTNNVILECPYEGNATYVIHAADDWKKYIVDSRQYLRENYPKNYTKCVHKGDWLERVEMALRSSTPLQRTPPIQKRQRNVVVPESADELASASLPDVKFFIRQTLEERPNNACPEHSIATFTLGYLGIKTRSLPRKLVEKRIIQAVKSMVKSGEIKRYKVSKNMRLKLVS